MLKHEAYPRRIKKKVYKAQHNEPGDFQLDYILLPVGYIYNAEFLNAKKGDLLKIADGGTYRIYTVRKVSLKSALADLLSRIRYGITINGCIKRWQMNAKLNGHQAAAVSTEECLWVVYEKEERDENREDLQD